MRTIKDMGMMSDKQVMRFTTSFPIHTNWLVQVPVSNFRSVIEKRLRSRLENHITHLKHPARISL